MSISELSATYVTFASIMCTPDRDFKFSISTDRNVRWYIGYLRENRINYKLSTNFTNESRK